MILCEKRSSGNGLNYVHELSIHLVQRSLLFTSVSTIYTLTSFLFTVNHDTLTSKVLNVYALSKPAVMSLHFIRATIHLCNRVVFVVHEPWQLDIKALV